MFGKHVRHAYAQPPTGVRHRADSSMTTQSHVVSVVMVQS